VACELGDPSRATRKSCVSHKGERGYLSKEEKREKTKKPLGRNRAQDDKGGDSSVRGRQAHSPQGIERPSNMTIVLEENATNIVGASGTHETIKERLWRPVNPHREFPTAQCCRVSIKHMCGRIPVDRGTSPALDLNEKRAALRGDKTVYAKIPLQHRWEKEKESNARRSGGGGGLRKITKGFALTCGS